MKSEKSASVISYISVAFYIITGFLYTPFLIRMLGISDYGIYTLSASLIGYFSLDFGISAAQTRLAARYVIEKTPQRINDMLGITVRIYVVIDIIILFLLFCIYENTNSIFSNLTAGELIRFKYVLLITSCFVVLNFPLLPVKGLFTAFNRVFDMAVLDLIYKVISFTVLVCTLLCGWGLFGVVLVNVSCNLLFQLIRLFYIFKKEDLAINIKAHDKETTHFIVSFSTWATLSMVADKFFFGCIPFLLAIFTNTTEIAFFAIVISIEGYVLTMSRSLSGIFLPRVMKLVVDNNNSDDKTNLMIRVGRVQLYIIGLIIVALFVFGREFFQLWLGSGFDESYYCMLLVLFPCLFHLTQTIAEELILATNNVKYRAFVDCIGSFICVVSICLLSPRYGAYGAAIGVFLSFLIAHNLIIDIIYYKKMNINMPKFFRHCHLLILPVFFLCALLGLFVQQYIPVENLKIFFLKTAVWGILSFLLLWLLSFNQEEKMIVRNILKII